MTGMSILEGLRAWARKLTQAEPCAPEEAVYYRKQVASFRRDIAIERLDIDRHLNDLRRELRSADR